MSRHSAWNALNTPLQVRVHTNAGWGVQAQACTCKRRLQLLVYMMRFRLRCAWWVAESCNQTLSDKFNASSISDCKCEEGYTMEKFGEGSRADYKCVPVEDPCASNPCGPGSYCFPYEVVELGGDEGRRSAGSRKFASRRSEDSPHTYGYWPLAIKICACHQNMCHCVWWDVGMQQFSRDFIDMLGNAYSQAYVYVYLADVSSWQVCMQRFSRICT